MTAGNSGTTKIFGRKAVKLSKSQKEILHTCLPELEIPLGSEAIDVDDYFNTNGPLHLEIGFGNGEYTAELARACPDDRIIGCEIFKNGIAGLLGFINDYGIKNIRIIEGNALFAVKMMFAPETFDFIHINHPDPWPKKRHRRRRIIQPDSVRLFEKSLKDGGEIWLSTDVSDYADWMIECFSSSELLERIPAEGRCLDLLTGGSFCTRYEHKGALKGRASRHMRYRKKRSLPLSATSNG